jgi:hypothetical protein
MFIQLHSPPGADEVSVESQQPVTANQDGGDGLCVWQGYDPTHSCDVGFGFVWMTQTWPFKVLWNFLCNLIDICCWWVWVIWAVDTDVIAYFSQPYLYRVEIFIEEIWCCLQSWNRGTYKEVQELAIELIELGMPGLSKRGGKSFCWNIASLIKKLPLASFGCYEKEVGYMPLILCLSGCMCHKQSAFCYRFSMLSTEKCECPYFVWKWVRWLQGAVTKGNCFSCKILIWNSPLQAESAMAALNCSGAILGSLPIRWASPVCKGFSFFWG